MVTKCINSFNDGQCTTDPQSSTNLGVQLFPCCVSRCLHCSRRLGRLPTVLQIVLVCLVSSVVDLALCGRCLLLCGRCLLGLLVARLIDLDNNRPGLCRGSGGGGGLSLLPHLLGLFVLLISSLLQSLSLALDFLGLVLILLGLLNLVFHPLLGPLHLACCLTADSTAVVTLFLPGGLL